MRRDGIARRLNELCESENAKALANLIDWATRLAWVIALLVAIIEIIL